VPYYEPVLVKSSWGRLPILVVTASFGLVITSLALVANMANSPIAMALFWCGVLVITIPIGIRLLNPEIQYREGLALVLLAGEMLFLVSVMRSYNQSSSYDGFLHWRTASDMLTTHHLLTPNTLLPVSPYYPGLEIVTTSLVNLTGLSIFQAGDVVVFVARWIMMTSLFMILHMLSRSVRAAGLGSLIYMGSTTFVFFDSQFAYESLSLPLAVLVLWLVLMRSRIPEQKRSNWIAIAVLVGVMVAITHHLMSYFLTAILLLWSGVALINNRRGEKEYVPIRITLILTLFMVGWLFLVAEITIGYLGPYFTATLTTLVRFIGGYQGDRPLFTLSPTTGLLSERLVSLVSVLLLLISEGLGLLAWLRSYRQNNGRQASLTIVLVLISVLYPLLPLLHLNGSTWEVSDRMASFVFIGLAFVSGLSVAATRINLQTLGRLRVVTVPVLGVIICAGIIGGSNPATRLPGAYLVEADGRSIDSYGVSAADWAKTILGPDNRMAGDREQSLIMGSLGQQTMVFGGSNGNNISPIFLKPTLGASEIQTIRTLQIRYLVIDQRISQGTPLYGYYFENWEQQVVPTKIPIDPRLLEKFDYIANVSRIFDNGNVRIYDIGGLSLGQ
jgi:hypothetical protein